MPLILNAKETILQKYPLLNSINYKEFTSGIDTISQELVKLITPISDKKSEDTYEILIESKYSGKSFEFKVPTKSSFKYLRDRAVNTIGLNQSINIGANINYEIKWVIVDIDADSEWQKLDRFEQNRLTAFLKKGKNVTKIFDEYKKLENNIHDGIRFYLYAVEDNRHARVYCHD